jgi:hypothetical protein
MKAQIQEVIHEELQEEVIKSIQKRRKRKTLETKNLFGTVNGKNLCGPILFGFIILVLFGQGMEKQ